MASEKQEPNFQYPSPSSGFYKLPDGYALARLDPHTPLPKKAKVPSASPQPHSTTSIITTTTEEDEFCVAELRVKDIMVEHPNNRNTYYLLGCPRCRSTFGSLEDCSAHLVQARDRNHANMWVGEMSYGKAIMLCGILVVDATEDDAENHRERRERRSAVKTSSGSPVKRRR